MAISKDMREYMNMVVSQDVCVSRRSYGEYFKYEDPQYIIEDKMKGEIARLDVSTVVFGLLLYKIASNKGRASAFVLPTRKTHTQNARYMINLQKLLEAKVCNNQK